MATWRTIADTEVDPDSPVTSELMTALRDNLAATAEGASGAPSVLPNIAANATAGAVGTYVFAIGSADKALGDTISGASLSPTSAAYKVDDDGGGTTAPYTLDTGTALSGTWRCMGEFDLSTTSPSAYGATLWLRIS